MLIVAGGSRGSDWDVLLKREDMFDSSMITILRMAVETELRKRKKLDNVNTVDDVVDLIRKANNIMILAGAGLFPHVPYIYS